MSLFFVFLKKNCILAIKIYNNMRLRDLINRLETLSQGGKNDDLDVEIENLEDPYQNLCASNAYITRYESSNLEYDYIIITTT